MIVTAWILFIVLGLFSLSGWHMYYFRQGGINILHFSFVIVATIITAILAGYIFGDLKLF